MPVLAGGSENTNPELIAPNKPIPILKYKACILSLLKNLSKPNLVNIIKHL